MRRSWWGAFLMLVVLGAPLRQGVSNAESARSWGAQPSRTTARCPADVVVLGGDLDAAERAEVLARLAAPAGATLLTESMADERRQGGGLIPAELLGVVAISSGRLTRLPATAGLSVRTDGAITLATAHLYATALLIAGVADARVWVTAPSTARALGTTALLGLLRAARAACVGVQPARERLAIRALVLTSHVAQAYGPAAAARLLDAARGALARGTPPETAVDGAIAAAATPLRPVTREALVALLRDLAAAAVLSPDLLSPPAVRDISSHLAGTGAVSGTASPVPGAAVRQGIVAASGGGQLTVTIDGATRRLSAAPGGLSVTRNGRPTGLGDLEPGDAATIHLDPRGHVTRVDARGSARAVAPTSGGAATGSGVVLAATAAWLTYRPAQGSGSRRVENRPGLGVERDGQVASLAALRPGDAVTVQSGPDGLPLRVSAVSPRPVARDVSVLRQPWPLVLFILLVVLGLLLVGLRGLPGRERALPFALVDRYPGARHGMAAPVSLELGRGARVLCLDGEAGRLAHAVVDPATGALARVVLLDRDEVAREVPAHLITSTSPTAVQLSVSCAELEAEMERQRTFAARHYRRLPVQRRRPADDAPLLQTTADTLRVEVARAPRP